MWGTWISSNGEKFINVMKEGSKALEAPSTGEAATEDLDKTVLPEWLIRFEISPLLPQICQQTTAQGNHSPSTPGFFTSPILNYCRTSHLWKTRRERTIAQPDALPRYSSFPVTSVPGNGSSFSESSFKKTHSLWRMRCSGKNCPVFSW